MKGTIFDIKHYAVHDGPGIRTTIFLKGCPLHCWWCHNPEGQGNQPEKVVKTSNTNKKPVDKDALSGQIISIDELMKEIKKDMIFYEESDGGVTFSGGEPMLQFEFLKELLNECKKMNIHTCIDTSGYAPKEAFSGLLNNTDLFLFDLKHLDDNIHKKYTGVGNHLIISNLKYLIKNRKNVILRFPVVPGINDSDDNITAMKKLLLEIKGVNEIDLLPYHRIGSQKYKKINMDYKLTIDDKQAEERAYQLKKVFEETGYIVKTGG